MTGNMTEQERFWSGAFGEQYTDRNTGPDLVAGNIALFAKILARTVGVSSVLELGANKGLNLMALRQLLPAARMRAVEINPKGAAELRRLGYVDVEERSLLDYVAPEPFDLTLIKTVLIHINPERLASAYDTLYQSSRRYIVVAEYYNPTAVTVEYRGHTERLFKRDFAGELLDRHKDLRLVDYGFAYHRDAFPQDDITWFLLEKPQVAA